jgi:hypothetical protein
LSKTNRLFNFSGKSFDGRTKINYLCFYYILAIYLHHYYFHYFSDSTITIGSLAQVGALKRGSSNDGSVYVQIIEEITHPDYDSRTDEYDFRVFKLNAWVDKPVVPLNGDPNIPGNNDDEMIVIGMGRTQEDGNVSKTLLSTEIQEVDSVTCQKLYPEYLVNERAVICAAGEGKDRYVQSFFSIIVVEYCK